MRPPTAYIKELRRVVPIGLGHIKGLYPGRNERIIK
jgi:hypothetical protein